jgi:hypothetical protein
MKYVVSQCEFESQIPVASGQVTFSIEREMLQKFILSFLGESILKSN